MGVERMEVQRSIQVVLFDLGGTLFYDDPAEWTSIYPRADRALWDSLKASGVRATAEILYGSEDGLLQYYYQLRATGLDEPGTAAVLRELLAKRSIPFSELSLKRALRAMYAVTQSNWHVEDDAIPALQRLSTGGIRLGVVSNGSDDANARRLLEKGHLNPFFELILTSAAFGRRKPDPSIFRAALTRFGVRPQQAVMVGDNYDADIVGGQAIGMKTIWITRRLPPTPVAPAIQPEAKVGTLTEIPALIV
jgi:HAD superfamily hydrolase (TIGR01549 family)